MEPNTPPDSDAITPQQQDTNSTHITSQPSDDPRWTSPRPPNNVGGSPALPVLVAISICMMGMCVLGALVGSWILVLVGLVAALLTFHYFAWGWLYTRMVAAKQKEALLRLADEDAKLLPDPQRSRHI